MKDLNTKSNKIQTVKGNINIWYPLTQQNKKLIIETNIHQLGVSCRFVLERAVDVATTGHRHQVFVDVDDVDVDVDVGVDVDVDVDVDVENIITV